MGYAVYEDRDAQDRGVERWAGYGVPAECDVPGCTAEINRGMAYRCEDYIVYKETTDEDGEDTEIEMEGCGLSFCEVHLDHGHHGDDVTPKPDTQEWSDWMLTDESWQQWRDENPTKVSLLKGETK